MSKIADHVCRFSVDFGEKWLYLKEWHDKSAFGERPPRMNSRFGLPVVIIENCPFRVAIVDMAQVGLCVDSENRSRRACHVLDKSACVVLHKDQFHSPWAIEIEEMSAIPSVHDVEIEGCNEN